MGRIPAEVQESFSEEQLSCLKVALGARSWGTHAIDWRGTLKFMRHRYYVVFLLGRNRRELSRAEQQVGLFMQAAFLTIFLTFSILTGLLTLYLAKSAAGINLIPGFSLGIWGWFKDAFL
ncbi:hypothetical protein [Thiorhodovibrio frisius]|uniref:3-phosphoshikimate 1-carboxyvinyltransferase n=1 Tax=Thiorhodovibrio frisius TaxID=631362 RepID=H8Z3T0_9GAMM|nr:hypothetical protein [Thiorhodovibrio frisius]EIC21082.1 hypothetical protein Thi970DRAFT_04767 [Thiorhodovibrio frisius]WPL22143.1 hypothetical protein Thiofri_02296 [Thiorhodovibrio frisius]